MAEVPAPEGKASKKEATKARKQHAGSEEPVAVGVEQQASRGRDGRKDKPEVPEGEAGDKAKCEPRGAGNAPRLAESAGEVEEDDDKQKSERVAAARGGHVLEVSRRADDKERHGDDACPWAGHMGRPPVDGQKQ